MIKRFFSIVMVILILTSCNEVKNNEVENVFTKEEGKVIKTKIVYEESFKSYSNEIGLEDNLIIYNDILEQYNLVDYIIKGYDVVIRGEFDNWTSYDGVWERKNEKDVLFEKTDKGILIKGEQLVKRALSQNKIPKYNDLIKVVVFNEKGELVYEMSSNERLLTLLRGDYIPIPNFTAYFDSDKQIVDSNELGVINCVVNKEVSHMTVVADGYFSKSIDVDQIGIGEPIKMFKTPSGYSGDLRMHIIETTESMGDKRNIIVYLPKSYNVNKDKFYPVLYMNDGQHLFGKNEHWGSSEWNIDETLLEYENNKDFNEMIVVGVFNSSNRLNEYVPWGGKGDDYVNFIINDVKPFVDRMYRTKTDSENTGIGGCSLGGLISTYAGLKYPEVFGNVVGFSSSLWLSSSNTLELVSDKIINNKIKIYLYSSNAEGAYMVLPMKRLYNLLVDKGYIENEDIKMVIVENGRHSPVSWRHAFKESMKWVFQ